MEEILDGGRVEAKRCASSRHWGVSVGAGGGAAENCLVKRSQIHVKMSSARHQREQQATELKAHAVKRLPCQIT